jgi:hypothetical protein
MIPPAGRAGFDQGPNEVSSTREVFQLWRFGRQEGGSFHEGFGIHAAQTRFHVRL